MEPSDPSAGQPPDDEASHSRWRRQVAAMFVAQVISAVAFSFALPFLPLYIRQLGVADDRAAGLWTGASSAGFSLIMATLGPVWGTLADRRGPRLMVGRAMFGGALVIGSMGLVANVYQLLALRLLQGAITGVQAAITVLVAALVPRRRLGWTVGLLQMATFSGATAGPLLGGLVAGRFGYRPSFVITGALMVLSGTIVFAAVPERAPALRSPTRVGIVQSVRWAAASRSVLAMVVVLFLLQFAVTVVSPVLPLFVKDLTVAAAAAGAGNAASGAPVDDAATATGLVLGLGGLFGAASAIAGGKLADAVGHKPVVLAAAIGSTLLYAPQAWVTSVPQLLALRVGLGLFNGALIPSTQAIIGLATPPDRRGIAFGIAASAASLGSAAGPLIGAGIAAAFGIRPVFLVTAALLAFACFVIARLPAVGET